MGNLRVACRYAEQIETAQTNRNADRPEIGFAPTVVQQAHYDPWGVKLPLFLSNGKDRYQGNPENRFKFTGKEAQPDLSWIDLGAKMYDPTIGRENGVDQLSELDFDLSTYTYSGNNPINFVDLFGLRRKKIDDDSYEETTPFDEVVVKAQREPSGSMGYLWDNYAYLEDQEKNHGYDNKIGKGFRDGSRDAATFIVSVPLAIAGAGAAIPYVGQGIAYLTRARMANAGRWLLRKNLGSGLADLTIQKITDTKNEGINWTSVLANTLISNPFGSAFVGSAFDSREGQDMLFGTKGMKNNHVILYETVIGGLSNKLGDFASLPANSTAGTIISNYVGNTVGNIGNFAIMNLFDNISKNKYNGQGVKENIENIKFKK